MHTIIELGYGTVQTANDLCPLLHLEKSSVSRLVKKLKNDDLIKVGLDPTDKRSRVLSLTQDGKDLLSEVERFARHRLHSALDVLSSAEVAQIETGLVLFAKSLSGAEGAAPKVEIHEGYRSGIIASITHLHASFYAQNYGFGAVFERKVATELSEFMGRVDNPMNTVFSAYTGDDLLGSVSIDAVSYTHLTLPTIYSV